MCTSRYSLHPDKSRPSAPHGRGGGFRLAVFHPICVNIGFSVTVSFAKPRGTLPADHLHHRLSVVLLYVERQCRRMASLIKLRQVAMIVYLLRVKMGWGTKTVYLYFPFGQMVPGAQPPPPINNS